MTNKDLLEAMQHLGAQYTDEADARAARHAAGFGRNPLMPALTVLARAAACAAVLVGVIHMGSAGEQMQTLSQDISSQIALEEAETTAAPERTASAQTTAVTVTSAVQTHTTAAHAEVSVTEAAEPEHKETIQTTHTEAEIAGITAQTEPSAYEKPILVADQISGHAGETVAFSIYVEKNPGINWFTFTLGYDRRLRLKRNSEPNSIGIHDVTYQTRELPEDGIDVLCCGGEVTVSSVFVWDLEEFMSYGKEWRSGIEFPYFNYDEWYFIEGDGMLITYYFDIPADAKSGTVYDMELTPATYGTTHGGDKIKFDYLNGSITVL